MDYSGRWLGWICLFSLVLGLGCSDVSPTNPFDPATPIGNQAEGRISGTVILPLCTSASLFEDVEITKTRIDSGSAGLDSVSSPSVADGERVILTAAEQGTPCEAGRPPPTDAVPATAGFSFDDVSPGAYVIRLRAPGYQWAWGESCVGAPLRPGSEPSTALLPVQVDIGSKASLCPLTIAEPSAIPQTPNATPTRAVMCWPMAYRSA